MDHHGTEATGAALQLVPEPDAAAVEDRSLPGGRPVPKMIVPPVPEWPRLGASTHPAGADLTEPEDEERPDDPVDSNLEIEDGDTTLFEAAIGAFHAGEFQRAESLFLEEAERPWTRRPQRAAIAYRQAALAARQMGNTDASDHWMRLAGREYLRVTEDARTPLPFIREAAVMAAKCFLSVENSKVASKGLRRAQAIESVLRADDDLMARGHGSPIRLVLRRPHRPDARAPPADGAGDDGPTVRAVARPIRGPGPDPTDQSGTDETGGSSDPGRGRPIQRRRGCSGSAISDQPTPWPDRCRGHPTACDPARRPRGTPAPAGGRLSDIDVLMTTEGTYPYRDRWSEHLGPPTGRRAGREAVRGVLRGGQHLHGRPVRAATQSGPRRPGPAVGHRGQRRVQPAPGVDRPTAAPVRDATSTRSSYPPTPSWWCGGHG